MQARPPRSRSPIADVAALVEAVEPEARFLELLERAREIDGAHQRHDLQRAGGGLGQHAGIGGRVAFGDDDAGNAEGGGRAQDGADIVRVGDLVERQHEGVIAAAGQHILEGGSSSGATRAAMP